VARVFQVHPHIVEADAIGYAIRALDRVLRAAGHSSFMVYSAPPPRGTGADLHPLSELLEVSWRADDLLILHHSFLNPDLAAVLELPVRKALIYHNITPAHYFYDHGMEAIGNQAEAARRQLAEIAPYVEVAVGDSEYNAAELAAYGFDNRVAIPVFYDDSFFRSRELDWPLYQETKTAAQLNLVFIGRMVPNKRIDQVIATAAEYAGLFGRRVRLHLIGKILDEAYTASLMAKAAELRVLSLVRLHLGADKLQLKTLLAAADAFVSFSEHEGFMVPVVEAFTVGCPVIAQRSSAVGETMGGAGLALDAADPPSVAGLVELLRRDRQLRQAIQRRQFRRARDFQTATTAQRWKDLLHREFALPFAG
jgi:glycosyltransferase involved in cell wall biosynthesis